MSAGSLAAQHETSAAVQLYREGELALLKQDYEQAAHHFRQALRQKKDFAAASRLLGQARELQGRYVDAAEAYRRTLELDSLFSRTLYFQLGELYYKMNRPELALHYLGEYERLQAYPAEHFGLRGDHEQVQELLFRDRLPATRRAAEIAIDSARYINITRIHNLGPSINSPEDEYFPFLTNDQRWLYFTRQYPDGDEDLYFSHRPREEWRNAAALQDANSRAPEGMSTLVRDGRTVYYTACGRAESGGPCDLWIGEIEDRRLQGMKRLEGGINSSYWDSQAAVSCGGDRLFFASNRPGGLGGTDIWVSERRPDGTWREPVNLGAPVNSPGDEEAPFISNDGQTLYFSSTGHDGLGEQDIFMSWWDKRFNRWSTPINLGPPVNSPHRELGFFLSADGRTGYFASDRPGGEGKMDIYTFSLSEKLHGRPITFVEGFLLDSVLREPVAGTLQLNDSLRLTTTESGRFFLCTDAGEDLLLAARAGDYLPYRRQIDIPEWDNTSFYRLDILLQPEMSFLAELEGKTATAAPPEEEKVENSLLEHSVYFDFDKADISSLQQQMLDEFLAGLDHLRIDHVEIVGYTDDIGNNSYNLRLSEERAKEVAVFILKQRIPVQEVHIAGEGSVIADGRKSANRRVDIRIALRKE